MADPENDNVFECINCGEEFELSQEDVDDGKSTEFCSEECEEEYYADNPDENDEDEDDDENLDIDLDDDDDDESDPDPDPDETE